MRDQFEQELGAGLAQGDEAQLINDQQFDLGQLALEAHEAFLVSGLHQFVNQRGCGDEGDGYALLAGGEPQAECDMGLSGAGWAERDDVLPALDPFAAGQLQHHHLVQTGDGLEVEAVEAFDGRELRRLYELLYHAPFAID